MAGAAFRPGPRVPRGIRASLFTDVIETFTDAVEDKVPDVAPPKRAAKTMWQTAKKMSILFKAKSKDVDVRVTRTTRRSTLTGGDLWTKGDGEAFVDQEGRILTLRGVNLAGTCKYPASPPECIGSHLEEGFFKHAATVSFVGRPFPIEEADLHFIRLRAYGCTVVRLLVTWEAVEHEGPGKYDQEYLDYMKAVVEVAAKYDLRVYVDPHQDVYSRFSGGSGAPAWTFATAGLDVTHFVKTGAALVHPTFPDENKLNFPRMAWATNLHKLACGTMFTLFWGGATYAPKTLVDGENIQHYLQRHYIAAMAKLARALRHCPNVIGFGTMNEPMPGYIGIPDIDKLTSPLHNYMMPTPYVSMALGSGHAMDVPLFGVDIWSLATGKPKKIMKLNTEGESAWLPDRSCIWKEHGVWGVDEAGKPTLLKSDYFAGGSMAKEYAEFAPKYMKEVRAEGHPDWMCFVELPPLDLGLPGADHESFPKMDPKAMPGVVHAPHWYDQLTLFFGSYYKYVSLDARTGKVALGKHAVLRMQIEQIAELAELAKTHLGGVPTLIGEFGVPFDLNKRELYNYGKDKNCKLALRRSIRALEGNAISYTLWCYAPEHVPELGDVWNREDLSIYSATHKAELAADADPAGIYTGGRALTSFVRPYCMALSGELAGIPVFNDYKARYELRFSHTDCKAPTLIFIPVAVHYPKGYDVYLSDGSCTVEVKPAEQGGWHVLSYAHDPDKAEVHVLQIKPKGSKHKGSETALAQPAEAKPKEAV